MPPAAGVIVDSSGYESSGLELAGTSDTRSAQAGKPTAHAAAIVPNALSQAAAAEFQVSLLPEAVTAPMPGAFEQRLADLVFQAMARGAPDLALVTSAAPDAMRQPLASPLPSSSPGSDPDSFRLNDLYLSVDLSSVAKPARETARAPHAEVTDAAALGQYFARLAVDEIELDD